MSEALEKAVYVGEAYKPFGELTAGDARTMAEHFRGLQGGGMEVKIAPVAMAWSELARKLDETGGTVSDLDDGDAVKWAERTRVVPPGGSLLG